jgi:hypothetical protein
MSCSDLVWLNPGGCLYETKSGAERRNKAFYTKATMAITLW